MPGVSTLRKFEFGVSFDQPLPDPTTVEAEPVFEPAPPPSYSQAELDAAESRGFAAGQIEGTRLAVERREHQVALALGDIAAILPTLGSQVAGAIAQVEHQAAELVLLTVERLFPNLIAKTGRDEVALLLSQAFARVFEEPKVTVRCDPGLRNEIETMVRAAVAEAGFAGKVTIVGDAALQGGGCRVEWSEGGLERDPAALMQTIEAALRRGRETDGDGEPPQAAIVTQARA
jgi:flagellar assembly protein FliH